MNPVLILVAAHICYMLGFAAFAALLPELRDAWALSNAQAGIVGGMFFAGYVAAVSSWAAPPGPGHARQGFAAPDPLAAAGGAGFAWLCPGFPGGPPLHAP